MQVAGDKAKKWPICYTLSMQYQEKKFNLPALEGISKESVDAHLGLYAGYVKNFNAISAAIEDLLSDPQKNSLAISELRRRHSFEFDGKLDEGFMLAQALAKHWDSAQAAVDRVRQTGMMRGPGWSILYFNPDNGAFHMGFVGEQHQGHFVALPIILALDVWEHAYILDYGTAGKDKYIDAFFKNLNWSLLEQRFADSTA